MSQYFKENYYESVFLDHIELPFLPTVLIRESKSYLNTRREIQIEGRIDAVDSKDLDEQIKQIMQILTLNNPISFVSQEANRQNIYEVVLNRYPQIRPIPSYEFSRWVILVLEEYQAEVKEDLNRFLRKEIYINTTLSPLEIAKQYYNDFKLAPLISYLNRDRKGQLIYLPTEPIHPQIHSYNIHEEFYTLSKRYYQIPDYDYLIRKHNFKITFTLGEKLVIPRLISPSAPLFKIYKERF